MNQTPIPGVKQRLQHHLEETQKQKSRPIQTILLLGENPIDYNKSSSTIIPSISGILEKGCNKPLPIYGINKDNDDDRCVDLKYRNKKSDSDRTKL